MSSGNSPTSSIPLERGAGDGTSARRREQRRALARRLRRGLLVVALAGAGVATVLALRPRPVPVDVAPVTRGPLAVVLEETGTTRVADRYVVTAPVGGTVPRLAWTPGDRVAEGDVLAEIAPAQSPLLDARTRDEAEARLGAALSAEGQARAQVARASAAEELATQELARTRGLVDGRALPAEALEQADFALRLRHEELASAQFGAKVAAEQVRLARSALRADDVRGARGRHVDVLAPVSGRVLRVAQKSAGVVAAGTPLLEIGDLDRLEVVVDVATTDAVRLASGTPASIEGWGQDQPLAGRVQRIEPSAFTRPSALGVDEQRVNVVVALTEPRARWALLGDGYRVEAHFVLWQGADVVQVPHGATFRHGAGWAVFVVDGSTARLVPVTLGHRGEVDVEVLDGLRPGARVAVHPGERVADGVRVEIR